MENDSVSLFSRSSISFLSFFLLLLYFHFSLHLFVWRKLGSPLLFFWLFGRSVCAHKWGPKSLRKADGLALTHISNKNIYILFLKKQKLFLESTSTFCLAKTGEQIWFRPLPSANPANVSLPSIPLPFLNSFAKKTPLTLMGGPLPEIEEGCFNKQANSPTISLSPKIRKEKEKIAINRREASLPTFAPFPQERRGKKENPTSLIPYSFLSDTCGPYQPGM